MISMLLYILSTRLERYSDYHNTVAHFTQWCEHNHLHLNVRKTKEIVISTPSLQHPILINNETVEMVEL